MRTTITLDDALLERAREITGVEERNTLIHDGLRALIEREAARRLAALGGGAPHAVAAPRRRTAVARKRTVAPRRK